MAQTRRMGMRSNRLQPPKAPRFFALLPVRSPFRFCFSGRVRILFVRVKRPISRACWQRIEAPPLRPSLSLHSNGFMKANKVPHERNPFLLTGKRRWRPFRWIFRRTRRDGAANNLLSQDVKPA